MEEDLANLHIKNIDLSMAFEDLEHEMEQETYLDSIQQNETFSFMTKCGRNLVFASYIIPYLQIKFQLQKLIKAVIKCFNPSVDVEHLQLPQHSCAATCEEKSYKRFVMHRKLCCFVSIRCFI